MNNKKLVIRAEYLAVGFVILSVIDTRFVPLAVFCILCSLVKFY